jgi:hypothetical protein
VYRFLIYFSLLASPLLGWAQCTTEFSNDCECEDSNEVDCDLLPDITVSWQWGESDSQEYAPGEGLEDEEINYIDNWFEIDDEVQAMGRVRVGARTPNIGVGPLNLRGADKDSLRWMICYDSGVADTFQVFDPNWQVQSLCPDGSSPKHISWQRVYHKNSDGTMSFYEEMVGTMEYHPTHNHMHFDEWTIISLRTIDENNMDNPTEWPIIGDGAKVGFCVMDLGNCSDVSSMCRDDESSFGDGTLLSQDDFPNYGLGGGSYGCSPVSQGISSGYNDTYASYLDGMFVNIPLGTCNGDYAIVLEVPQVMIESRLDNNFTWFPITLTMQTEQVSGVSEITSSQPSLFCEGEEVSLSVYVPDGATILWSNGATSNNIQINEAGQYSVTVSKEGSECDAVKTIEINAISEPVTEEVIACRNETADLSIESNYEVTWYDENMDVVGSGNNYTTPALTESTTFYVSNSYAGDSEIGPENHEGDGTENGDFSQSDNAIGYLVFDAITNFTLQSVKVYADLPGIRKFVLMSASGDIVDEHVEFIEPTDEGQIVNVNFDVPQGIGHMIGTDAQINVNNFTGENPQLRRTGTEGGLQYPYILENVASINNSIYYSGGMLGGENGTDYTTYYYYLYDWIIETDTLECQAVPFPLTVEDCTNSISEEIVALSVYPNPNEGLVTINMKLATKSNIKIELSNIMGQIVLTEVIKNVKEEVIYFDWSQLEAGIYSLSLISENGSKIQKIVIQ